MMTLKRIRAKSFNLRNKSLGSLWRCGNCSRKMNKRVFRMIVTVIRHLILMRFFRKLVRRGGEELLYRVVCNAGVDQICLGNRLMWLRETAVKKTTQVQKTRYPQWKESTPNSKSSKTRRQQITWPWAQMSKESRQQSTATPKWRPPKSTFSSNGMAPQTSTMTAACLTMPHSPK